MHGKLICVVFLLHNTLLMLISLGFLTSLMLFWWRPQAGIDLRYSREVKDGMVWANCVAIIVALANVVNGFIANKKEKLSCYYVYMALSVINLLAPLALMKLIFQDGVVGELEDKSSSNEDSETLIVVVNAFACAFFGSNFICFYNAYSMQYALKTQISRIANASEKDKSTSSNQSAAVQLNEEEKTGDSSPSDQESATVQFNKKQGQLKNS